MAEGRLHVLRSPKRLVSWFRKDIGSVFTSRTCGEHTESKLKERGAQHTERESPLDVALWSSEREESLEGRRVVVGKEREREFLGRAASEQERRKQAGERASLKLGAIGDEQLPEARQIRATAPRSNRQRDRRTVRARERERNSERPRTRLEAGIIASRNSEQPATMSKLYVGNLPSDCNESALRQLFQEHSLACTTILVKRGGYAFVDCADQSTADRAIDKLNGEFPP
ncbi:Insulin-like growth factor 2 mRNA-binding protein 3-A [Ooceraea biroi]|uniref:Insulin-like growth factor 2 mRNA-binding protein 3-A n=1 Tax=Ooceraea biroi TaxID=2015173 RepID=A0A026X2Z7_OOCBI|nr:Insulin-like growth factor 2 mRNA-binding protein 3-A [Ooceraea biroi]